MTATRRLTGRLRVDLPPDAAFRLFTPRGERDWADDWHPHFPAAAPDDTEPGTVFQTAAHGQQTTWLVTERQPGRRIAYARVTPGDQAGTVTVDLTPAGGVSEVAVTYQLTALSDQADAELADFAAGYADFLRSWQDDITTLLNRHTDPAVPLSDS
ncbi:MAG TPA: SRPBCC family protein [Trebonia sp.]